MANHSPQPRPFRHSIRFKLLLASLTILLIPWAGYRYIQETEEFLRNSQESLLIGTARALAQLLQPHANLFQTPPTATGRDAPDSSIYLHALKSAIHLDGYGSDWRRYLPNKRHYGAQPSLQFDLLAGEFQHHIYLLLQVVDDRIIYRKPGDQDLDASDFIELLIEDPGGKLTRYRIATLAPGWVRAEQVPAAAGSGAPLRTEPRIQGEWQESAKGYTVELSIPRYLVGARMSVGVGDVDDERQRLPGPTLSTSPRPGPLIAPSAKIEAMISGLQQENTRFWVLDRHQHVLATRGRLTTTEEPFQGDKLQLTVTTLLRGLFHLVLDRPSDFFVDDFAGRSRLQGPEITAALQGEGTTRRRPTPDGKAMILSATWPIQGAGGVIGAVLVEQSTNRILSLQSRATESLFGITLLLFVLTLVVLLAFATRLVARIRRLSRRVEEAVAADGRILGPLTIDRSKDEIGDLGRSFSGVLKRLTEYNRYLEAMASRLAHELRTPLTVVRSSLENLEQDHSLDERQRRYIARAKQGSDRLGLILHQMREATRLEQLMQQTRLETFDLAGLMEIATESYRSAFAPCRFELKRPEGSLMIRGAPDLIGQALDKLINNAVDFHRPETPIILSLQQTGDQRVRINVFNQGPALPEEMVQEIFGSMVSMRQHKGDEPHLGLGLYLVRLICEFHHGRATAENLPAQGGVRFTIELPVEA